MNRWNHKTLRLSTLMTKSEYWSLKSNKMTRCTACGARTRGQDCCSARWHYINEISYIDVKNPLTGQIERKMKPHVNPHRRGPAKARKEAQKWALWKEQ